MLRKGNQVKVDIYKKIRFFIFIRYVRRLSILAELSEQEESVGSEAKHRCHAPAPAPPPPRRPVLTKQAKLPSPDLAAASRSFDSYLNTPAAAAAQLPHPLPRQTSEPLRGGGVTHGTLSPAAWRGSVRCRPLVLVSCSSLSSSSVSTSLSRVDSASETEGEGSAKLLFIIF